MLRAFQKGDKPHKFQAHILTVLDIPKAYAPTLYPIQGLGLRVTLKPRAWHSSSRNHLSGSSWNLLRV